ncbi:uncharacterized protein [Miscanthus floridulus]|uniref:uncharacterized protein n=1 Tax=Miscanthus floridulus TaxID=154761 RepID=UPI00345B483A
MPGPGYHYSEVAGPSVPNAIASQNQYQPWTNQPHPDSAAVFPASGYNPVYLPEAGVYAQQPSSATVLNAPGYNSNPHAFVYQPGAPLYAQPGAATDFSAWGGNANDDPYTSAGLVAPPANANQGASRGPVAGDSNRSRLALQNVQANDLLGAVQRANTPGELVAIVDFLIWNQYNGVPLMEVAEPGAGETALKKLVRLVALHLAPGALQRLFRCLIHGWIMEQSNGPHLLQHFFTTLDYVHCSIFIDELAVPRFWEMVTARIGFGHRSMMTCLDNTGYYTDQGTALHVTFVYHTVEIARNIYGSQLLRAVFERGRNDQLKERIRERVVGNVVELSMDQYGNNVVQACFIPSIRMPFFSVILLQRGLQAFLPLPGEHLRELVQNHCARYVLHRLLRTSVDHNVAAAEAMQLAERILGVGWGYRRRGGDPRAQAIAML